MESLFNFEFRFGVNSSKLTDIEPLPLNKKCSERKPVTGSFLRHLFSFIIYYTTILNQENLS